ncbi:MAG: hypothetical protein JWM26_2476, partial [Betaproteobacteria bacterium]|nr:hypothetical protein [Betaproteobacteria bacterium]
MSARERMLALIRERQGKPAKPTVEEIEAVRSHLAAHPRNPAPRDAWDPLTRFRERALSLASTVDEAGARGEVPSRVAAYLGERGLGSR